MARTFMEFARGYLGNKGMTQEQIDAAIRLEQARNKNLQNHWDTPSDAFGDTVVECFTVDLEYAATDVLHRNVT
jgi:hypothetical protein